MVVGVSNATQARAQTLTGFPLPTPRRVQASARWSAEAARASVGGDDRSKPARIGRLSMETLHKEPLTSPPEDSLGDLHPSYSPDGTHLAFARSGSTGYGDMDVWVQPAEGGEARQPRLGEYNDAGPMSWTPDSAEIVFTVIAAAGLEMLRVGLAGGQPQPVPGIGQGATGASIRGDRMVYTQAMTQPTDIWRGPGRKASTPGQPPEKLIASSGEDYHPAYSPDGRRIAFQSAAAASTTSGRATATVPIRFS